MLIFWTLIEETQKSTPLEPTRHHNLIKLWILLPLRADLFVTLQYEIPCSRFPSLSANKFASNHKNYLIAPFVTHNLIWIKICLSKGDQISKAVFSNHRIFRIYQWKILGLYIMKYLALKVKKIRQLILVTYH